MMAAAPPGRPRFLFDRVFAAADAAERRFDRTDLESSHRQGLEEGFRQGLEAGRREALAQAGASSEAMAATTLQAIARQLDELCRQQAADVSALEGGAARLVHAALTLLLPELARRGGSEEILGVVRLALTAGIDDPELEVRLPPALRPALAPRLEALVAAQGYRGRLAVVADQGLAPGAVAVRWSHGAIERDPDRLLGEIRAFLDRTLLEGAAPAPARSAA